jgi:hydroxyethylthiazole kinase
MFSPQLVKGNVSEILALLAFTTQANGVDTGDNHLTIEQLMKMRSFCQSHSCTLLLTEIDVIVDFRGFICLKTDQRN